MPVSRVGRSSSSWSWAPSAASCSGGSAWGAATRCCRPSSARRGGRRWKQLTPRCGASLLEEEPAGDSPQADCTDQLSFEFGGSRDRSACQQLVARERLDVILCVSSALQALVSRVAWRLLASELVTDLCLEFSAAMLFFCFCSSVRPSQSLSNRDGTWSRVASPAVTACGAELVLGFSVATSPFVLHVGLPTSILR